MLKETFIQLLSSYSNDEGIVPDLWNEIESAYSDTKRKYHTLKHLENLLHELTDIKSAIHGWDTILLTLYYHDIVYNTAKNDNQEQSAVLAEKRMRLTNIPNEVIEKCNTQILATKQHKKNADSDTNFFIDADLSVLGQNWETYSLYFKNIREEYSMYEDALYNAGRKKVLEHFLTMKRIYKTQYFFEKYEHQARVNMQREIEELVQN